ncbi:hypothetical protein ABZ404_27610 [Streptomyces sp. NPDC005878]|uniref:hypothetical protein n=1 Tax=Streptomyces sp. NPDC005878 TaxID=3157077 RepID=UPI0033D59E6E
MTQPQTLTAGARLTGSVLCALLALITAAWLARDIHAARSLPDLWRFWSGTSRGGSRTPLTTGILDPVLLLVYAVAAAVVPRAPSAAAVLSCVGAVTALLRVSSLWVLHHDDWTDSTALHDLHRRALLSTFAALAGGLALVITAAAGRRSGPAPGPGPRGRPGPGAATTALLVLGAAGLVMVAWEIYWAVQLPGEEYRSRFAGARLPLLWLPGGWVAVVLAVIALAAAAGGPSRAPYVRPLGLITAAVLVAAGASGVALAARFELLDRFGDLDTAPQLQIVTWFFQLVAGLLLVPVLARRGPEDPAGTPGAPWAPGYPPYSPYSPQSPQGPHDAHGGGFGPPPPGFGPPPPPSSPPPGW